MCGNPAGDIDGNCRLIEPKYLGKGNVDLRGYVPFPRLQQPFEVAYSADFLAKERNPNKELLRATILELREQRMSYREIAQVVGLHWTRIQQIVK